MYNNEINNSLLWFIDKSIKYKDLICFIGVFKQKHRFF